MISKGIDINEISNIIKKTIGEIDSSRKQIVHIVDNIRSEYEYLVNELNYIKKSISEAIQEVDELEKQDKIMRQRLVDVSKNFKIFSEEEVKAVYDAASNIRINYLTRKNEEKILMEKRNRLEFDLKKCLSNMETGEKIINQVGIALGYLDGNIRPTLEEQDKNSQMFMGIKILEAQENERKRIARDIHDGPAQHMANVIMKVDICKKIIEKDLDAGFKELGDLKENVKIALNEVRSIIFDLRPMTLDDLGLNQTIEQTINKISEETGMEIELKLKPINREIESIIQVAVYRIVQEIFSNIKKHSKAKHSVVRLDFGNRYLMLIISDDGIGFNVEETLKRVKINGSSYGLIGILDRVNQLQGEIHIESSKETGTIYKVKLPINREVIKDE